MGADALPEAAAEVGKLDDVAGAPPRSHGLGGDGEAIYILLTNSASACGVK